MTRTQVSFDPFCLNGKVKHDEITGSEVLDFGRITSMFKNISFVKGLMLGATFCITNELMVLVQTEKNGLTCTHRFY